MKMAIMDICNQPRKFIGWLLVVGSRKYYNINLNMRDFSRKVVIVLIVIFAQSSLRTNAILLDGYNLGQNGYVKYSDGFLIQWGYNSGSTVLNLRVNLPIAFYNSSYIVTGNVKKASTDSNVYAICPTSLYTTYFYVDRNFASPSGPGTTSGAFFWTAIGRWK
ncbi:hypothetical protein [Bacteroides sp. OM05-10AA]|uniref:gp53-like domain-containing protein n=1 Tax=Bacteroides sp. OM05-10AA TaxID=2292282 RepID=UPI0011C13179|nr:hypothetical protein [Bacteroides sp. OM05-10AA]